MSFTVIILLSILGLCYGSFMNVLLHRTMNGESIIYPFSKCPKCGHSLYWWHNIPILSFVILKGKCYFCNKTISIRYPIIEIIGLIIFLHSFMRYTSIIDSIATIIVISLFLIMAYTDFKVHKISTIQAIIIAVAGLVFNRYDLLNSVYGLIIFGGVISALIIIGEKLLKKETFGLGDIYIAMAFGAVIGYEKLLIFVIYSLIIQFLLILPRYITDLIKNRQIQTLKYLIIFFIACLFLYVSKNINILGSNIITIAFLGIVIFTAIKLSQYLLNSLKQAETASYCPLAPSFALTCILFLC